VIFVFMISQKSLEKFKRLYKERFKEELTDKEALRKATRLLNLYRTVYGSSLRGSAGNSQSNEMKIKSDDNYYEPKT